MLHSDHFTHYSPRHGCTGFFAWLVAHLHLTGRAFSGRAVWCFAWSIPTMKLSTPLVHKVVPFPAAVIRLLVWSLGAKVASFFPGKQYKVSFFFFFVAVVCPLSGFPWVNILRGSVRLPNTTFRESLGNVKGSSLTNNNKTNFFFFGSSYTYTIMWSKAKPKKELPSIKPHLYSQNSLYQFLTAESWRFWLQQISFQTDVL